MPAHILANPGNEEEEEADEEEDGVGWWDRGRDSKADWVARAMAERQASDPEAVLCHISTPIQLRKIPCWDVRGMVKGKW